MIGKTLGTFECTALLGKGGMGEVYLAEDTSFDRKVALHFVPDVFTSNSKRTIRFELEAKHLASLNHPNIAGIYELEQADIMSPGRFRHDLIVSMLVIVFPH